MRTVKLLWNAGVVVTTALVTAVAVVGAIRPVAAGPSQAKWMSVLEAIVPGAAANRVRFDVVQIPEGGSVEFVSQDAQRLIYVVDGAMTVRHHSYDLQRYSAGDAFQIAGGVHHDVTASGAGAKMLVVDWANVQP